jgi:DNA replicative helicase MCM subunit Mcm2 (Cdc46/Mcm family)
MSMDSGEVASVSISPQTIREIARAHTDRDLSDNEVESIAEIIYEQVQEQAQSIYDDAIASVLGG